VLVDDGTIRLGEAAGLEVGQPVNALGACHNRRHSAKLTPRRSWRNPIRGNGHTNRRLGDTGSGQTAFPLVWLIDGVK
jgi:hypothetical protein